MKTTISSKKINSKVADLNLNRQEITFNVEEGTIPRKVYDCNTSKFKNEYFNSRKCILNMKLEKC